MFVATLTDHSSFILRKKNKNKKREEKETDLVSCFSPQRNKLPSWHYLFYLFIFIFIFFSAEFSFICLVSRDKRENSVWRLLVVVFLKLLLIVRRYQFLYMCQFVV